MDESPARAPTPGKPNGRFARISRSPSALFLTILASLAGFELAHRVLELHPLLSSSLLTVVYLPLLIWAVVLSTSAVITDPDNLGHIVLWALGFAVLTIGFFAILYAELGIVAATDPAGPAVRSFTTCLYFSATTFTTVGFGDYVPTPESRLFASVEALTGYVVLGTITAVVFFLLSRRAGTATRPNAP
ncbi:MAG: potassium channel family protein [Gemmatimonadales bacterium]